MADPIRVFIDGACQPNPGNMGIGVVVEWQSQMPTVISEYGGEGTNNIAEYKALNRALKYSHENLIMSIDLKCDSMLVVSQMKKVLPSLNANPKVKGWKCNEPELIQLRDLAVGIIKDLRSIGFNITLDYIPRELNLADDPAKKGCSLNESK